MDKGKIIFGRQKKPKPKPKTKKQTSNNKQNKQTKKQPHNIEEPNFQLEIEKSILLLYVITVFLVMVSAKNS